ncbi:MAG: hypothetical protein WKF60_06125 [Ilumatobacter sp.]
MRERPPAPSRPIWRSVIMIGASVVCVMVGLGMVLIAFTLGRCDAFGGRCPADRPPFFDDDAMGTAALGAALFAAPFALRRSRRWWVAVVACALVAAAVGLLARGVVHGEMLQPVERSTTPLADDAGGSDARVG